MECSNQISLIQLSILQPVARIEPHGGALHQRLAPHEPRGGYAAALLRGLRPPF